MNISLKEKVQHWFNFLRLAHESQDPVVVGNLKVSRLLYEPWGDYRNTSFKPWWREHSKLFRSVGAMRKMVPGDVPDESALFLAIPYIYAPTTVAKMVQNIYQREQNQRRASGGKVKKVYGGQFALTAEDLQASQFHYYYRFARDVYLPLNAGGDKPTTKNYVDLAEKVFAKQKLVTSWEDDALARRKVPFTQTDAPYANKSRMARNYVVVVLNLLRNVAKGEFPGDYLTVAVKNQGVRRKASPEYSVRATRRGVSQKRYQEVKKRENPFDPYRE
jgi:hypothetical protein